MGAKADPFQEAKVDEDDVADAEEARNGISPWKMEKRWDWLD